MNVKILLAALIGLALLLVCRAGAGEPPPLTLALIGDSTVCDYEPASPKRGWGQVLPEFLNPDNIVVNEAKAGESTQSFPAENWRRVRDARPDFVFIQFGHNDMKKEDPLRYADPATSYRENLKRFIQESRAFGATPILVTPVSRRTFRNGQVTAELLPYAEAMKAVGAETGVAVIDLNALSHELFQRLGEDGSDAFTANKILNPDSTGRGDRTHFTEIGAREIARLAVAEFPRIDSRLAGSLKAPK